MKVLMATDSFPPVCGGSGWSTYELARGLRARGHEIAIVHARQAATAGERRVEYDGFRVREYGVVAPDVPYIRNYIKNERLYPVLARYLRSIISSEAADIVHGQHVLTCLPSIEAAHDAGVPAVCTVRDYWPVCYWSDLINGDHGIAVCPECSSRMMTRCIRPRAGAAWPAALPMIPYMRANLRRKRRGLAAADAVIAVSAAIAADLRARAPELADTRITVIPNAVDLAGLRARAAASPAPLSAPYALYMGKLAPNKGTAHLVEVIARAGLDWPLVIAGDGPDRAAIARAAAESRHDVRMLGWLERDAATAWLAHASMLIFPSRGPESLSRVLIEASALGVPIAAMNTGGTAEIVVHDESGLLSGTPHALADDVRRIRADADLRRRLGAGAMRRADALFEAGAIASRMETVYASLIEERRR